MPLPANLLMSMGIIGVGVLALFIYFGFAQPQAIHNTPNRPQENGGSSYCRDPQRPIVCNDCSICQEEIEAFQAKEAMRIKCGHRFHSYCLKEWLKKSRTCPSCRCMVSM